MKPNIKEHNAIISFEDYKKKVIQDYKLVVLSRQCSILGRREVLNGKGKFGIFGDGKELPQVVLNHFFQKGDYRAGYYRDQTLLMAQGLLDTDNFFADQGAMWAANNFDPTRPILSGDTAYGGYYETVFTVGANAGKPNRLAVRNPLGLINSKNDVSDVNRFIGNAKFFSSRVAVRACRGPYNGYGAPPLFFTSSGERTWRGDSDCPEYFRAARLSLALSGQNVLQRVFS